MDVELTLNNLIASGCMASECSEVSGEVMASLVCNKIGWRHRTQSGRQKKVWLQITSKI